jgi:hypothetical protein
MEMGRNIAEDAKFFFYYGGIFCPCCDMALRASPTNRKDKERHKQSRFRRE